MKHRPIDQQAYSSTETARLFGISKNAALHAAAKGDLPSIRVGKLVVFPKVKIDQMLGLTASTAA